MAKVQKIYFLKNTKLTYVKHLVRASHIVSRDTVLQLLSRVQHCDPMDCRMPGFPVFHYLPELAQTHVHRVGDAIQPSCPLSSSSLAFSLSSASESFPINQFSISSSQSIGASASASVLPMNIQNWFPLGWTDLISLQSKGLSSLLQHHSSKASILQRSAFFLVQFSHPYMITGKAIALTIQTFVGKVMSLLFTMLSRFVIAFL